MSGERWERGVTTAGAVLAGLAVAAGAFGAHALRNRLGAAELAVWETAVRYQMYHALALLLAGRVLAHNPARLLRLAGVLFGMGIVLFSGSLYLLAVTGQRWLGAITPFGGVAFLLGWASFALASLPAARS